MTDPRRRHSPLRIIAGSLCLIVAVAGLAIAAGIVLFPHQAEQVAGNIKLTYQQLTSDPAELPTIQLGPEGGKRALDNAPDKTFIEMTSYRIPDVPPVYAAHNNRGGDIILGWKINQQVTVIDRNGIAGTYVVVEERQTPKWANVEKLAGMRGPIVVQTCFYGKNLMRFLSLVPLAEAEATVPPTVPLRTHLSR